MLGVFENSCELHEARAGDLEKVVSEESWEIRLQKSTGPLNAKAGRLDFSKVSEQGNTLSDLVI